ncbi:rhodanese-like domain-containing protein [Bacillus benzoevorans]|uniref:Rhodanese-related sulfurtransferase n=1 Tax=Bacillus benzoevorans TaxID=1456 RepID=A0A7X0HT62_9BACI|nr:rhodanese-like domain-containing protein [Bacillus benzoevorans]MBB6445146.1 rhodanese-related sulfurtransferase [Bacillus benzoevorans]
MKKTTFAILIVCSMLMLAACGSAVTSSENSDGKLYEDVNVKHAKELIDKNEVVVIDVRTEAEYKEGHIPNATLIPEDEIDNRMEDLDKDTSYLMVCRSGNRSSNASEMLAKSGFTHIKNMKGGMNEWTYEIEK